MKVRKSVEYTTVVNAKLDKFDGEVHLLMEMGWRPSGSAYIQPLFCDSDGNVSPQEFFQPMTRTSFQDEDGEVYSETGEHLESQGEIPDLVWHEIKTIGDIPDLALKIQNPQEWERLQNKKAAQVAI